MKKNNNACTLFSTAAKKSCVGRPGYEAKLFIPQATEAGRRPGNEATNRVQWYIDDTGYWVY